MQGAPLLLEMLERLSIPVATVDVPRLLQLVDELLRWNRHHNLTAITDPAEAIEKHLVDSLTLRPLLTGGERLLDLGSGGGFPGLPLKIVCPELLVVSVDAVAKKIAFQRHVVRMLGLRGFEPLHIRAEALADRPPYASGFDLVVSRAFAALPSFAALALPCLRPGGRVVAMKGAEGERELEEAAAALAELGLARTALQTLRLPTSGALRTLLVFQREEDI